MTEQQKEDERKLKKLLKKIDRDLTKVENELDDIYKKVFGHHANQKLGKANSEKFRLKKS